MVLCPCYAQQTSLNLHVVTNLLCYAVAVFPFLFEQTWDVLAGVAHKVFAGHRMHLLNPPKYVYHQPWLHAEEVW